MDRSIDPLVVSWDWDADNPFHQVHRWQGTRDPAALDFLAAHDWPRVRDSCHTLLASVDLGLEPLTDEFVQMRGYRVPTDDPRALQRRLFDEHRIEVPVFETRLGTVLRVSVQAYNDEADLDALEAAVA